MTALAAGSSVTFTLGSFQTLSIKTGGVGTLSFTSVAPNAVPSFTAAAVNGNFGPYNTSMTVVMTMTAGSAEYTLTGGADVTAVTDAVTGEVILMAGGGRVSAGGAAESIPFSTTLSFSSSGNMPLTSIASALAFTIDSTGAVDGSVVTVDLLADGVHIPTFDAAFREWGGSSGFLNTANIRNTLTIFRRSGVYYYSWGQAAVPTAETYPIAPAFSSAASISGAPMAGIATNYSSGTYSGAPTPSTTQQWYLDGVAIGGATGASYTPVAGDVGHSLSVVQTVTNASGSASSTSNSVTVAAALELPGAPTSFASGTATYYSVPLTWGAPSSGGGSITDYVVQYAAAGTGFASPTTYSDGTSSVPGATVTGLSVSTAYDFRVAAVNSTGQGAWASLLSVSTTAVSTVAARYKASTVRGNVTESGNYSSGFTYLCPDVGGTFAASFVLADVPKLAVGAWFSVDLGSPTLDQSLFGISTSASPGSYAGVSLNGVWNDGAGNYRYLTSGGGSTSAGVAVSAGDKVRIRRTGSTTAVAELSTNGGATWPTNIHTWTISSGDQYIHAYPHDIAGGNRCGPLFQNGMTA